MKIKLTIFFFCFALIGRSQYDVDAVKNDSISKEPKVNLFKLKEKIFVGTDLSLSFGNLTYIYIAPLIGYDITKKFSSGFSSMYQLLRLKYPNGTVAAEHSYGGGIFLRYRPFQQLILHTELDLFNTVDYSVAFGRINAPAFMMGAGYAGSLGERAYYSFLLMYDFIHDPNMPIPAFVNIAGVPFYFRYGFVWHLG